MDTAVFGSCYWAEPNAVNPGCGIACTAAQQRFLFFAEAVANLYLEIMSLKRDTPNSGWALPKLIWHGRT
jgi:hypothetical protein